MILSIISFVLVFGSENECPLCDTINPQYRYSCCHNKLCSECWAKMKGNDISQCAYCRRSNASVETAPDWIGKEAKKPELTKQENQKLNGKLIQKNKYDSQQDLQTKQMLSKLAMEEDDELG